MFFGLMGYSRIAKGTNAAQRYVFFVKYGSIDCNFFKYCRFFCLLFVFIHKKRYLCAVILFNKV